jgi:hypothetical protein
MSFWVGCEFVTNNKYIIHSQNNETFCQRLVVGCFWGVKYEKYRIGL